MISITAIISLFCVGFLSYTNGANDNFKGVATLFGSKTTNYKKALVWATITTLLGSIVSIALSSKLIATFSGKGLVPDSIIGSPSFSMTVAMAAALTVWLATRLGFPISTTHALTGALMGAGLMASQVNFSKLGSSFFFPLIFSPLIALLSTILLSGLLEKIKVRWRIEKDTCVCLTTETVAIIPVSMPTQPTQNVVIQETSFVPTLKVADEAECREQLSGTTGINLGINAKTVLDLAHFTSAGLVCFARAINDTPKIAAIFLASGAFSPHLSPGLALGMVAVFMVLGGVFSGKKVAETLSHRVTKMNADHALSGNLVTGLIVFTASHLGVPVSTTHVSCGSLFGIGAVNGKAQWKTIFNIVLAWMTTLPLAALLGSLLWLAIKGFGE